MLDRPKNAWKLLALLTFFALGFLVMMILLKPFRDHEGHSVFSWTVGNKAQAVAQVAALLQYAMAALCVAFGSDMPVAVEGFVILVCLVAIIFPLVYMHQLNKGKDMLGDVFPSKASADGDDDKAVTPVSTENPAGATAVFEDEAAVAAAAAAENPRDQAPDRPAWAVGQMVEIQTEDGLERAVRILGSAESGQAEEMRVRFLDGVVDDWQCSEFASPQWQTGTLVDIDTEDGVERGAQVLGPPKSGNAAELRVKFADGTVDDWEVSDFI
eukprot:COSAG06_NODE_3860_length_4823_cov_4.086367_5_plen_270_part_00